MPAKDLALAPQIRCTIVTKSLSKHSVTVEAIWLTCSKKIITCDLSAGILRALAVPLPLVYNLVLLLVSYLPLSCTLSSWHFTISPPLLPPSQPLTLSSRFPFHLLPSPLSLYPLLSYPLLLSPSHISAPTLPFFSLHSFLLPPPFSPTKSSSILEGKLTSSQPDGTRKWFTALSAVSHNFSPLRNLFYASNVFCTRKYYTPNNGVSLLTNYQKLDT